MNDGTANAEVEALRGQGDAAERLAELRRQIAEARQPKIGDVVHYVSYETPGGELGKACRAATVTEVAVLAPEHGAPSVGLCVLNPTGLFFHPLAAGGCRYDDGGVPDRTRRVRAYPGGTWHWPE